MYYLLNYQLCECQMNYFCYNQYFQQQKLIIVQLFVIYGFRIYLQKINKFKKQFFIIFINFMIPMKIYVLDLSFQFILLANLFICFPFISMFTLIFQLLQLAISFSKTSLAPCYLIPSYTIKLSSGIYLFSILAYLRKEQVWQTQHFSKSVCSCSSKIFV